MAEEINRQSALAKAQREAGNRLKAAHLDEWNGYMQQAAAAEGVTDWKPRESPEEKAERQLQELLANNPALAQKYGATATPSA